MKLVKKGECRHCGRCCDPRCPYLFFIVLRGIKEGEVLNPSKDFGKDKGTVYAVCTIFNTDRVWRHCSPEIRKKFPTKPEYRYPGCGYYFTDEKGRKIEGDCFNPPRYGKD